MTAVDLDEAFRNLVVSTMKAHVVRETQTIVHGYRWNCACGSTNLGRVFTPAEHQAQAVLDALRAVGWRSPHTIDGEVVEDAPQPKRAQIGSGSPPRT